MLSPVLTSPAGLITPGNLVICASLFQDVCSRSPSIISLKTGERFIMELKKSGGSLGISVAVSGLSLCVPNPLIHPAVIEIKMFRRLITD